MNEIFISYRRADSASATRTLTSKLEEQFSPDAIFWDIPDIEAGDKFGHNIEQSLSSCKVLLAVIGPTWLNVKEGDGKESRRLDNPDDYVRKECATALRGDVHVIPVLVDGAVMPKEEELPDDLKDLAAIHGQQFSERTWEDDFEKLAAKVQGFTKLDRRTVEGTTAGLDELKELGSVIDRLYQFKSIADRLHELYTERFVAYVRAERENLSGSNMRMVGRAVRSSKTALEDIKALLDADFLPDTEKARESETIVSFDAMIQGLARVTEPGDPPNRDELREVVENFSYCILTWRDSLNKRVENLWSKLRLDQLPKTFARVGSQLPANYQGYMRRIDEKYKALTGKPPFFEKCKPLALEHGSLQNVMKNIDYLEDSLIIEQDPSFLRKDYPEIAENLVLAQSHWESFFRCWSQDDVVDANDVKDDWAKDLLKTGKGGWESIKNRHSALEMLLVEESKGSDHDLVLEQLREVRSSLELHFRYVDQALMKAFREVKNHLGDALRDIPGRL